MTQKRKVELLDNPALISGTAPRLSAGGVIGPIDASQVPRYSGIATFALLPRIEDVESCDVAVVGAAFDAGVSFRSGARFGPAHVRESSRLLRPYNPAVASYPFGNMQVADAGDVPMNPFDIEGALTALENAADRFAESGVKVITIGGDHSITLPLLRSAAKAHGPVSLVHFDAHLDTNEMYFGSRYTHGTPFKRAYEEDLIDRSAVCHIGTRGPLYSENDLTDDAVLGFAVITSDDVFRDGVDETADRIRRHIKDRPVYVSIDVDVMDPAFAPGTGTPEAGGLSSREVLNIIRQISTLNLIGADVVEVAPPYDNNGHITGVAASHIAYELITWMTATR